MQNKSALFWISIFLLLTGCRTMFMDVGTGYTRFETDDIVSRSMIKGKTFETRVQHVDGAVVKLRTGGEISEALPQIRTGVEMRTGIGAGKDTEKIDNDKAYSEVLLLMFGGGPFVAWKQPLGRGAFIESGLFITGYTTGVHEKGREDRNWQYDIDQEGGVGWSGGAYAKLGFANAWDHPANFSFEASFEKGKWDFGKDVGDDIDVKNFTFMMCSEFQF